VAPGRVVKSATVTLQVAGKGSRNSYALFELRRDWAERECTWKLSAAGKAWERPGASGAGDRGTEALGTLPPRSEGAVEIALNAAGVALVQRWIDRPEVNFGLLLGNPEAADGLDFDSREAADPKARPRLALAFGERAVRALYGERFEGGRGKFLGGDLVTDGSQALSVPAGGVSIWKAFAFPVGPATRVRFRLKPVGHVPQVTVMAWSPRQKDNARYFIRGLKEGEWSAVDFRAAELRVNWDRSGASLEGDILDNLKLLIQGENVAGARVLLDDFEVIE
jgi:hypothetical protein